MKKWIKPALLLSLPALACYGADSRPAASVEKVTQRIVAAQEGVRDVRMDLDMDMKDSLSGSTEKVRGTIQIKAPDMVFVHYTKPTQQFLYMNGGLAQMYQPDQKMVFQQREAKGKGAEPLFLGVGKELSRYFGISRVSIIQDSDSVVGLLLIPFVQDAGFDKMRVYVHKKDWWPYEMDVETPSMTTRARFSHYAFNQGLKDSLFQFTPPKSAQVVEGTVF
jgi:outer membrane lipoprotein carrier protein